MNKLLIGLLLVAAGAGAYFLLKKKKEQPVSNINKEWIIGKWKTVQYQPAVDSLQPMYQYDFLKEGTVLRSLSDTVKADTTHYEWSKNNDLVMKQNASDSASQTFTVVRLTIDSLQLRSADSVEIIFTKLK